MIVKNLTVKNHFNLYLIKSKYYKFIKRKINPKFYKNIDTDFCSVKGEEGDLY